MQDLFITNNQLNSDGFISDPAGVVLSDIKTDWISIFDQNGYILTKLEQKYYKELSEHRGPWEHSLQMPWFTQHPKWQGAVLNHALLFQRKGFSGRALKELERLASFMPLVWKVAKIRPKWGIDFSIDWTDDAGNVFEILHFEWDDFSYESVQERKEKYETIFLNMDWDDVARQMLLKKDQWHHLDFFRQSAWKCDYLGIEHEQFKMVCWK